MRKAEAVNTKECPVKIKLVAPPAYVFTTQTLDKVYVTMYLNDFQRSSFYEGIGLDAKEFDMHVIIETNRTTARIFPAVLDVENPEFKRKLDRMVEINTKLLAIGEADDIAFVKNLKRIPLIAALASELLAAYLMKPVDSGSVDLAEFETQLVY